MAQRPIAHPERLAVLVDLRREAGISQTEMARLCGLTGRQSHQTAGAWERGEYAPSPQRRTDFAHYLWDRLGLRREPTAFDELWAVLSEEWGWEPFGDDEWRALTHLPRPSWSEKENGPGRIPFQPPLKPSHFVGRQSTLEQLYSALKGVDSPVVALVGMGGVGKTTLAVRVAHEMRAHFDGGVLWGNPSISGEDAILESWGQALGYDFGGLGDVASKGAALRDGLEERAVLLVLDNVDNASSAQKLLVGGPRCRTLLTTRNQDVAHALHGEVIQLLPLAQSESQALLTHIVGSARVEAESRSATEICELLEHLPLAVEIVAQRLRSRPERSLAETAERLGSVQTLLSELTISDRAVRASFETSWEGLSSPLQSAFASLSLFQARSFRQEAFQSVVGGDPYESAEHLYSLAALSLVSGLGNRRYRQHPLLAQFAQEKADVLDGTATRRQRFAAYYLGLARRDQDDSAILEGEWENLIAGMQFSHSDKQWTTLLAYADALTQLWHRQTRFTQARQGLALAVDAALALNDPLALARQRAAWGFACLEQDDYAEAANLLRLAMDGFDAQGDEESGAQARLGLARLYIERGEYAASGEVLRQAWQVYAQADHPQGLGRTLYWQGLLLYHRGEMAEAGKLYGQARVLQEAANDQVGLIATLRGLADVAVEAKEYAQAQDCCAAAFSLARVLDDRNEQAAILYLQAVLARKEERYTEATIIGQESLDMFERMGDRGYQALLLFEQSQVQEKMGKYTEAEALAQRSCRIAEQVGQEYTRIFLLFHLGHVQVLAGQKERARTAFQTALALTQEENHPLYGRLHEKLAEC